MAWKSWRRRLTRELRSPMLKTSHVFCGDKFVKVVSSVEMKQKMDESILHIIGVYRTVFGLFVCLFFLSLFLIISCTDFSLSLWPLTKALNKLNPFT